jgi:hypothetical protein
VMWLLTPTIYWLHGETISLTNWMWMGLMMSGRLVPETNAFEVEMTWKANKTQITRYWTNPSRTY